MIPVELLIEPLRQLIAALGTGILAPGNPAEQVRTVGGTVESVRQRSTSAAESVLTRWDGAGAAGAAAATAANQRRLTELTECAAEFGRLVESAGRTVHMASTALNGVANLIAADVAKWVGTSG